MPRVIMPQNTEKKQLKMQVEMYSLLVVLFLTAFCVIEFNKFDIVRKTWMPLVKLELDALPIVNMLLYMFSL